MKNIYNSLKRNLQEESQLFFAHFWGESHSGIARYVQNWKVSCLNPTDALAQALGRNLITRLLVTLSRTGNSVVINIG